MLIDIDENTRHIVLFSAGKQSAEVALSVHKKYGKVELLNHNICQRVEAEPIKIFKQQVADYLQTDITYANHKEWAEKDQFDVCVDAGSFINPNGRHALCTSRLKTEPFERFLAAQTDKNMILYYGFDKSEESRVIRRSQILGLMGYATAFPLFSWPNDDIVTLDDVGLIKPCTYSLFAHANCVGCIKARKQHWYVVFCHRPDIWEKAKQAEEKIGFAIGVDVDRQKLLIDIEPYFVEMKSAGVVATEKIHHSVFWREAKKRVYAVNAGQLDMSFFEKDNNNKPCDCAF